MRAVLLLNGPPRCGKDTVAEHLREFAPTLVHIEKLAAPIKQGVRSAFHLPYDRWKELDSSELTDKPCAEFFGQTPRKMQIEFSESYLKVFCGQHVCGELLVRRLKALQSHRVAVISDSGFRQEAEAVVKAFGSDRVFLWKIVREGYDFSGDSRGYIDLSNLGVRQLTINNDADEDALFTKAVDAFEACIIPRGLAETAESPGHHGDLIRTEQETYEQWQERVSMGIKEYEQRN